jgi:energy-coupling factor transporter transmembrane protein EcfT
VKATNAFFMQRLILHPTTRLALWVLLLLSVQVLERWLLIAAFSALPLLGVAVLKRGWRLAWRARWLLLSLFVIFSWGVAGEPLWDGFGAPSFEGLADASTNLGRLLLVLIAVAALLEAMPMGDLLSATRGLLAPLRRFGLDGDRGVVRLLLVLRYVETLPRPRDWRQLLDAPPVDESELIVIDDHPLRRADYLALLVAVALLLGALVERVAA